MKKVLTGIIVFLISIVLLATLFILEIGSLNSKDITNKLIKKVKVSDILINKDNSYYINLAYNRFKRYGISENNIEKIISSDEFNNYSRDVINNYMDTLLNDNELDIDSIESNATQFINNINNNFDLDLSDDDIDDISYVISSKLQINSTTIKYNRYTNMIIYIVKYCGRPIIKIIVISILVLLLIILYILTSSNSSFINHIGIILIVSSILLGGINYLLYFIVNNKINYLSSIVIPINNHFYILCLVFIIISIFLFIISKLFNKKKGATL